jgi:hypothetical protein
MKDSIKQYARDKKGHPIGVMVAVNGADKLHFGWSLCNKSDTFNKYIGTKIADNRARTSKPVSTGLPESLTIPMRGFVSKAIRYYNPNAQTEV